MMKGHIFNEFIIFNVAGLSTANISISFAKMIIPILSHFYPDRMFKLYLINTSFFIKGAWWAVRPFVHTTT